MKASEIEVGKTYVNRHGNMHRRVIRIKRLAPGAPPLCDFVAVSVEKGGRGKLGEKGTVLLSAFAAWAFEEVE